MNIEQLAKSLQDDIKNLLTKAPRLREETIGALTGFIILHQEMEDHQN